ncbi:Uncharacterized protein TCM_004170 [Theobroma cacao]|uniref:Uncharacterized protein n=1 Tax=Theobroma cacao TaxID=3641 RepID=A0A061DNZ5_THECC|nr:Uncharacterized protein TCM_004170 [Theobroma cacao]
MIRNIMAEAASSMRCPPGASISEECYPFLPNAPVYASASSDLTPVVMSAILELETMIQSMALSTVIGIITYDFGGGSFCSPNLLLIWFDSICSPVQGALISYANLVSVAFLKFRIKL